MEFDQYDFTLGSWWASAIINGDYSGLTDKEEQQLEAFLSEFSAKHPNGHWDGFAEEDSAGFTRDEITGLGGDCYNVRYMFPVVL